VELRKEHEMKCPLKIGTIVKMTTQARYPGIGMRPCVYWHNKRDREIYTVIGIERNPSVAGGWMIHAQSETGRKNNWMSIRWYKKA